MREHTPKSLCAFALVSTVYVDDARFPRIGSHSQEIHARNRADSNIEAGSSIPEELLALAKHDEVVVLIDYQQVGR